MVSRTLSLTYRALAAQASGSDPYSFQERLAHEGLTDVLRAPTGTGKTLAAVLPWLYRRRYHPDADVRASTPRWLVFVLPQRALVEQTVRAVEGWLRNLGSDVPLHTLMGGEDTEHRDWKTRPEQDRIFIGTQDIVLSWLLMRGFAEFRDSWPMSFGLLHAGVQFVFDEVQLMGPGLPTSMQLQGLREVLGDRCAVPHYVDVGHTRPGDSIHSGLPQAAQRHGARRGGPRRALSIRLEATRTVRHIDLDADIKAYARALASRVLAEHR